ncbi:hypothetical protein [Mycobacterium montefiorense]|uniref:Uncharacterized protein n=1 Tax=Mycobacterium montefiorense TaxID=154654 RepID=A0AA37UU83_9MYCO|nr:hypothetical protein [Mycobacterium montefiorense]GBG37465.1 hypothetical protein MmonteBS_18370 [Mycobacterium montefiorense]GKU35717.1 hypothetical protein NJB14191_30630 [Mycobacterium montefiorense]GKU38694.1 hypothetical protein NJB14192_06920 [Mycobacterium montefiorense]GKU47672.1 hypothetical protein NJB14194_42900 [Mycobacterium montefiorense]GKU51698.1 hypothetical protein NJB14195_29430 [Mycobacterium montefiorense]
MTKPPPTAAGIGVLELFAPEGNCVGTLIKQTADQPIRIAVPGRAEEDWPRVGDTQRTALRCPQSDKWFFPDTSLLQQKMIELINDDHNDKGGYFLY